MSDTLILQHIAATGGNIHEMKEHLNKTEIARAKEIMIELEFYK